MTNEEAAIFGEGAAGTVTPEQIALARAKAFCAGNGLAPEHAETLARDCAAELAKYFDEVSLTDEARNALKERSR